MKHYPIAVFCLLAVLNSHAQNKPVIDSPAPAIELVWARNPSYTFKKPQGKIVILDFWFTSCAPCVYTLPHLNDLSEHYKNENVVFTGITFETRAITEKFLNKKKILANIGIDSTKKVIQAFGVESYPQTFIIDEKGVLRWAGYPGHLTTDIIDGILGKTSSPVITNTTSVNTTKDLPNKIYPISVTKNTYMDGGSGFQSNQNEFSMVNQTLDRALSSMLQISVNRILVTDTNRYDVRFLKPKEIPYQKMGEVITESLLRQLKYKMLYVNKKVSGYELTVSNDSLFTKNAIDTAVMVYHTASSDSKSWTGSGVQVDDLIRELESRFSIFIENKTSLNVFLKMELMVKSFEQAKAGLEHYGMTLKPKEFIVRILTIVPDKK